MSHALRAGVGALALLLILSSSVGLVAAQDTQTTTAAPAENESATTVVQQVDNYVVITDYSYDEQDEQMSVTLKNRGTYTSHATLTEIIKAQESGGGTFGLEQVTIPPKSEVEVQISARRWDSGMAGVMITTKRSAEQGTGAFVTDIEDASFSLFTGSAGWADVRAGVLFSGLGALGFVVIGSWHHYSRKETDVEEVDLDK